MIAKLQLEFEFTAATASFIYLKPQVLTVRRISTPLGHVTRKVTFRRRNLLTKLCEATSYEVQVPFNVATLDRVAVQKAKEQMFGFYTNAVND